MARLVAFALLIVFPAVFCAEKPKGRSLPPPPSLGGVGTSTGVHLPGVDATSSAGVGRYPFNIPGVPPLPGGYPYPGVGTGSNVNLPGVSAGSVAGLGYPGIGVPYPVGIPGVPGGYPYPGVGTGSNVNLPGMSAGAGAGVYPRIY